MIRSIRLRRWKSHEYSEVAFGKGTNVIVGPMGAGKSCVLEALCFALYGTTPQLKGRRATLGEMVMSTPRKYDEAGVEAWFDVGEKNYSVERTINAKGGSEAHLRLEGKIVESGPQRVTEAVERLLKVDYELFVRAIYSEQNKLDYFLALNKAERKKQADELLGIDAFENARSNAATTTNRLKALKAQCEAFLQGMDAARVEGNVAALRQEKASVQKNAAELEKTLALLQEKRKGAEARILVLEKAEELHTQISSELATTRAKKTGVAARKTELEKKKPVAVAPEQARKAREDAERQLADAKKKFAEGEKVARALAEAKAELSVIERQLEKKPKEEKGELERKGKEIEKALAELKGAREALDRNLNGLFKKLAAAEQEVVASSAAQKGLDGVTQELGKLDAAIKTIPAASAQEIETRFAVSSQKAKSLGEQVASLEASGATCPICGGQLDSQKRLEMIARKRAELEIEARNAGEAEKLLVQARSAEKRRGELEQKIGAANERKKIFETRAAGGREALASAAAAREETEKAMGELEENALKASEKSGLLTQAIALLREAQKCAEMEERKEAVKKTVGELAQKAVGGFDASTVEKLHEKLDAAVVAEEYALVVVADGELAEREKLLSQKSLQTGFDAVELAKKRRELVDASSQEAGEKERMMAFEQQAAEKERVVAEEEKKLLLCRERERERKKLEERIEGLSKYCNALVETQAALRSELVEAINSALAEFWQQIYPYRDYSAARLTASEQDYFVELQCNGNWMPAENASGGERSCAALALRASFATVLAPSLNWLVLDEPTHNLDANAVELLCTTLKERLPQVIEQVFVITHDEALKEGASHKVYRVDRDKDHGEQSTIEEMEA